jgi:GMP synthase (glutamine-hydrolysing)
MRSHGQEGPGGAAPWVVLRHSAHEGLGLLGTVLRDAGIQHRTVDFTTGDGAAKDLRGTGGLIVLGGSASICEIDRHPYLADECAVVEQAITGGRPVLGICLGAQIIAHVLGARVYHGDRREVGWGTVDLTPDAAADPLFGGQASPMRVFHLHGDTYDLPSDARLLARSELYEHQAFEWGAQVYGLQFHLELTETMIERLMADPEMRDYVTASGVDPDSLAAGAQERVEDISITGREVFERFFEHCGGVPCSPEP